MIEAVFKYVSSSICQVYKLPKQGTEIEIGLRVYWNEKDAAQNLSVTCINNGIYGGDFRKGEIRLSLLRSAGYCAHPIGGRSIMAQDRFLPRMDQGERSYTFWLNAGTLDERKAQIDREALGHNEQLYALSFFPSGEGEQPGPCVFWKMIAFSSARSSRRNGVTATFCACSNRPAAGGRRRSVFRHSASARRSV